jgi:hypothetical protein
MFRCFALFVVLLLPACAAVPGEQPVPPVSRQQQPLSESERRAASMLAERDRSGGITIAIFPLPDTGRSPRTAIVLRFDRASDVTLRTFVDLDARRVLRRDELKSYPTPLHPDEIDEAIAIARRTFAAIERAFAESARPSHDWTNLAHSSGPRTGHRLILLRFHDAALPASVLVDLSTRTAVRDDD